MAVARTGNVEAATLLLDAGADVNAIELWGQQSALMWAAAQRQPAMIKLLIARGADVDARGAVRNWERKVISEPRPKDMNQGGFTPLLYAAREGCIECAKELVAGGADLDLPDPHRVTPLNMALMNLHFDFAAYLIEAGADIDKWDLYGRSPLYIAADMSTHPRDGQRRDGRAPEHGQAEGDRRRAPVARQGRQRQRAVEAPPAVSQRAAGSRRRLDSVAGRDAAAACRARRRHADGASSCSSTVRSSICRAIRASRR